MQEQPPSDPPRREPAPKARRSRSPRPTFNPPTPEPAAENATSDTPPPRRPRRAAPTVVFQPPTPAADAPPAPRPRPAADPSPADPGTPGEHAAPKASVDGPGTPPKETSTTPSGTTAGEPSPSAGEGTLPADERPVTAKQQQATEPPAGPVSPPAGEETPKRARRAPAAKKAAPVAKKAAPVVKKAAPAVKKATRKASPPKQETAISTTEPTPTERQPDGTEPVTAERPVTAPSPGRTRRTTKAAPSAAMAIPATASPAAADTTTPRAEQSDEPTHGTVVERAPAQPDVTRTPMEGWRAVGPQLRDHPGFAPELLALAAVDALGPRAASWVEQVRRAYPEADADGVARLATRRFVRMAGTGGALAAGAGLFAPVAELATVLWTQANLVLHLAAAYGRDPAHPDRAAELLVLTLVHPDDGTARAALAAARAADAPAEGPWGRVAEAAWRLATPVAAQAGGWLGLRLAARLLPGAAALAAATGGTARAERVAARAVARYRA